MKTLAIELRKEKRTGIVAVLPIVGVAGAAYAFANFMVRIDSLLSLPMAPMDVLLTQLYGVIMMLNLFGILVAACMMYHMEFSGTAIKKMYLLPVSIPKMYLCKFLILTVTLLTAVVLQNLALVKIGMTDLPRGTFSMSSLVAFAGYSFVTSMPVLSFMLLVSSRFDSMWIPLGVGVAGFLTGMALGTSGIALFLADPFVILLMPAVSMSARPDAVIVLIAVLETLLFLGVGMRMSQKVRDE
ncbi:ABC transporter permease [uncultured Gemmiger sp.]|uniref:ABC transporter permease n=1 Tax=uncultured Gemmiger sp. TaxID=1623490 RepID=UPI0025F5407C|nr:ABC transporter permease [uncultured Gemmiger sp.]